MPPYLKTVSTIPLVHVALNPQVQLVAIQPGQQVVVQGAHHPPAHPMPPAPVVGHFRGHTIHLADMLLPIAFVVVCGAAILTSLYIRFLSDMRVKDVTNQRN